MEKEKLFAYGDKTLINDRWLRIPENDIFEQLVSLGINEWRTEVINTNRLERHYLRGERYAYPYSLPPEVVNRLSERLNEVKHPMTWYRAYNEQAIAHFDEHGTALNQALEYWTGVGDNTLPMPRILPVDGLSNGDEYIAIIGLFHLTGVENGNNHHLFVDLIDSNGNRIYNHTPALYLFYGWDGMTSSDSPRPVRIDKPPNEPGANIGMHWGQVLYGFHINHIAVDRFNGVHVRYGNDGDGNNQGHHSHYIILQKRIYNDGQSPKPPDPIPEPPDLVAKGFVTMEIEKAFLDSLPVEGGKVKLIVPIYR